MRCSTNPPAKRTDYPVYLPENNTYRFALPSGRGKHRTAIQRGKSRIPTVRGRRNNGQDSYHATSGWRTAPGFPQIHRAKQPTTVFLPKLQIPYIGGTVSACRGVPFQRRCWVAGGTVSAWKRSLARWNRWKARGKHQQAAVFQSDLKAWHNGLNLPESRFQFLPKVAWFAVV